MERLHHSPSQFVCSLPDLPPELNEISSLFQTSFSTFSSGHCFHSRFLLNMVLHFQQSTTEAEISLPYLTPKCSILIKIMKRHAILILSCYITTTLTCLRIIKTCLKIQKRQNRGRKLVTEREIEGTWNH